MGGLRNTGLGAAGPRRRKGRVGAHECGAGRRGSGPSLSPGSGGRCSAGTQGPLPGGFVPGAPGHPPFARGGWKSPLLVSRPHREGLFLASLPAFPLGKRCAVAPGCAAGSGRKGGSLGSDRSASGRFLAAGLGIGSGTAVILSASLQTRTHIRGNICVAGRKYSLLAFSRCEGEAGARGEADFKRGSEPLGGR